MTVGNTTDSILIIKLSHYKIQKGRHPFITWDNPIYLLVGRKRLKTRSSWLFLWKSKIIFKWEKINKTTHIQNTKQVIICFHKHSLSNHVRGENLWILYRSLSIPVCFSENYWYLQFLWEGHNLSAWSIFFFVISCSPMAG